LIGSIDVFRFVACEWNLGRHRGSGGGQEGCGENNLGGDLMMKEAKGVASAFLSSRKRSEY
jgi:hypothetical protein